MVIKDPAKVVTSLALRSAEKIDASALPARESGANQNLKSRSTLITRNVIVNGHRTSVRMEPEVWQALDEITGREKIGRNHIFTTIANRLKPHQTLSSAVRVFVIAYYRESSTESGHVRAGHGPQARD
jgi:predicted DNA-binding ribbon-helix-helix protein